MSKVESLPNIADTAANSWRTINIQASAKVGIALSIMKEKRVNLGRRGLTNLLKSDKIFPTELTPYNDAIEEAHALQEQGYSFIVPYNHYSYREPIDVMSTLLSLGKGFETAPYLSPLALHQRKPYIPVLSYLTDIPVTDIVTKDTVERKKNFEKQSLSQKSVNLLKKVSHQDVIKPKSLRLNHGLLDYIDQGSDVLAQQGIVFIAPQGGRRNSLGEPAGRAIEMLINSAKKKGVEKLAIWPMGILLQNTTTFDESTAKFNFGKTVDIKFGVPLTNDELSIFVKENPIANEPGEIDRQVFRELSGLLADAYTNPQKITDEQEAQSQA